MHKFLARPYPRKRLSITLNSNEPTTLNALQRNVAKTLKRLNNKTDRLWYKRPRNTWWQAAFFIEGHEFEAASPVTMHVHGILAPGLGMHDGRYLEMMSPGLDEGAIRTGDKTLLCERHITRAWRDVYGKGSVRIKGISDLPGWAYYCTKDLCRRGPHLRRAHEAYLLLPEY